MILNRLRGTVADRPIDSQVVQDDRHPQNGIQRIAAVYPEVEQVDVGRLAYYNKG